MPIYINLCMKCFNYLTGKTCLAFPNGIPDAIWEDKLDHKKPISGDHGVQFEEKKIDNSDN